MRKSFKLDEIDCANCARKLQDELAKLDGVDAVSVNFMTQKLTLSAADERFDEVLDRVVSPHRKDRARLRDRPLILLIGDSPQLAEKFYVNWGLSPISRGVVVNKKQRRWRNRIIVALAIFAAVMVVEETGLLANVFGTPGDVYASFALFLIPYLIAGYKTLLEAARTFAEGIPSTSLPHVGCVSRRFRDGAVPRDRAPHGRRRRSHALLPGGRALPELRRGPEPQVHRGHDGHRA